MIGGAAIVGLIYLLLLRFQPNEPSQNCLLGLIVAWLMLFALWLR